MGVKGKVIETAVCETVAIVCVRIRGKSVNTMSLERGVERGGEGGRLED